MRKLPKGVVRKLVLITVNAERDPSQELGGATVIGPLIIGLDRPVQIVPLGAKDSDIVNMAALAAFNIGG